MEGNSLIFKNLVREVLAVKWLIIFIITATTLIGTVYALMAPNIYKSEAILAPVSSQDGIKIPSQIGGLAALAGFNLGSLGGGGDRTALALEVLKSKKFIIKFIK